MRIDYHLHSSYSDGVCTPTQVVERAIKNQIISIALTDHDSIEGLPEAKEAAKGKLEFFGGIEITCRDYPFRGQEKPVSVHLLGLFVDDMEKKFRDRVYQRKADARQCYEDLIAELNQAGFSFTYQEIAISCGSVMQLCDIEAHINAYFSNHPRKEWACDKIASYIERVVALNIPLGEAIALIQGAGGKAVWAHPFIGYHKLEKRSVLIEEVREILDDMQGLGLDGLEVGYLDFTSQERELLLKEAKKRQLFMSSGSDFHGTIGREQMGFETSLLER